MQSRFMRWRNEGNEGYDPNRFTSPREGSDLGSGDLLYRAAADHTVYDSAVGDAIEP